MGSSEHPCDWLSRIYGLSVGLFRGASWSRTPWVSRAFYLSLKLIPNPDCLNHSTFQQSRYTLHLYFLQSYTPIVSWIWIGLAIFNVSHSPPFRLGLIAWVDMNIFLYQSVPSLLILNLGWFTSNNIGWGKSFRTITTQIEKGEWLQFGIVLSTLSTITKFSSPNSSSQTVRISPQLISICLIHLLFLLSSSLFGIIQSSP